MSKTLRIPKNKLTFVGRDKSVFFCGMLLGQISIDDSLPQRRAKHLQRSSQDWNLTSWISPCMRCLAENITPKIIHFTICNQTMDIEKHDL